jgi:AraC family transcriptional regulator
MFRAESEGNYGKILAKQAGIEDPSFSVMNKGSRSQLAITRLTHKKGLTQPTASVVPEKAFTISVHLTQPVCDGWGTWVDGKFLPVNSWAEGGIGIYDLESDPIALRGSPFDCVHYHLPRATLNAYTGDRELPRVDSLACVQGTKDSTIHQLTRLIEPFIGYSTDVSDPFWEHFIMAFCGHVVENYSQVEVKPRLYQGGLSPWQKRLVENLLGENLYGNLKTGTLANQCGLSDSHFARSFKVTFGISVHRYLILQRVNKAKSLLLRSRNSLTEIALSCGFSDQAAFSRRFGATVGTTPLKWRNEHITRRRRVDDWLW